jgi:hypothetical protein
MENIKEKIIAPSIVAPHETMPELLTNPIVIGGPGFTPAG